MADIPVLEPAADQPAPPGKSKRLIIIVASVVVLLGAGLGGWLMLHSSEPRKTKAEKEEPAKGPALYAALDPPFVVNFQAEQLVRFLQITVQVSSHDPLALELLKANDPRVRNDLLLLFANQKYVEISTSEGKEKLRAQALEVVRKALVSAGGKADHLEAVYFTSFVMQ